MNKLRSSLRKIQYAGKSQFVRIVRRTFEATKYPIGSLQRKELNGNALTSEYYPSKKYLVLSTDNQSIGDFRTKQEAEYYLDRISV